VVSAVKRLGALALSAALAACAFAGPERPLLADSTFATIRHGMTKDEILRIIGRPDDTMKFARSSTEAWDYRYQDDWGYMALFSVTFDRAGTVVGRTSQRLNDGGDHQ
jgi:outer membrane protein assembly factor BamE (lipoprotein component of BamABCDE complex)